MKKLSHFLCSLVLLYIWGGPMLSQSKKNNVYPRKPHFPLIMWGFQNWSSRDRGPRFCCKRCAGRSKSSLVAEALMYVSTYNFLVVTIILVWQSKGNKYIPVLQFYNSYTDQVYKALCSSFAWALLGSTPQCYRRDWNFAMVNDRVFRTLGWPKRLWSHWFPEGKTCT